MSRICFVLFFFSRYTREAGVRSLERKIGAICRAVAVKVAEGQRVTKAEPSRPGCLTQHRGISLRSLGFLSGCICTHLQKLYQGFFFLLDRNYALSEEVNTRQHCTNGQHVTHLLQNTLTISLPHLEIK